MVGGLLYALYRWIFKQNQQSEDIEANDKHIEECLLVVLRGLLDRKLLYKRIDRIVDKPHGKVGSLVSKNYELMLRVSYYILGYVEHLSEKKKLVCSKTVRRALTGEES